MKQTLLVLLAVLLGRAGAATPLPADTIRGQVQFVRKLSRNLCDRLTAESQKSDFSKLSGEEAQRLLTRQMFAALSDDLDAYQDMMKASGTSLNDADVNRQLGRDAVLNLMSMCPAARPLVVQMGMGTAKKNGDLSAAERSVLAPIAASICQRLNADNAKQPFDKMTPEARMAAIGQVMQSAITDQADDLTGYYGEEALEDEDKMRDIGRQIGLLMLEQCPSYIMLMGQDAQRTGTPDAGSAEGDEAPAPDRIEKLDKIKPAGKAARPKPAPARKRPVKK